MTVNILLRGLEAFNGIVIFATNLATNFVSRIRAQLRAHVLSEMAGPGEQARKQTASRA